MAQKLTKRLVDSLLPPTDGRPYSVTYDDDVPGLGVRVTRAGHRSWIFNYRTLTRIERRMTIGDVSDWPLKMARDEARRLRRMVDQGRDPMAERREHRAAPTIIDLVEQWRADAAPKRRPRTVQEYESLLRRLILPRIGKRKVADVTRDEIVKLHTAISKTAPVRANRCIALISVLFNIAVKDGQRPDNPAAKIDKNHEVPRTRYLNGDELARLTAALATHRNQRVADAIRLLLLTGARSGEVLGARWDQFDISGGVWTKPAAATKTKREHTVPLSPPVRQLLADIRASQHPSEIYVFPRSGGHMTTLMRGWQEICRAAGLEGVRVHDLRHSFASIAASSGASLPLIGALLGHSQPATTARYAHLFDEAQRAVSDRVGAVVIGANDNPGAAVSHLPVAINRRKR